jgi:hypothetical protein
MKNPWVRFGFDAWSLEIEASSVIGLRALKIAAGGAAADAESRLMLREKLETGWDLQTKTLTGALGYAAESSGPNTGALPSQGSLEPTPAGGRLSRHRRVVSEMWAASLSTPLGLARPRRW